MKGSPTLANGLLYFGDYGGQVQAVRASNGRRVWANGSARGLVRTGTFYATAAVAYGRVYIGSTDGRMYSLSARTGALAWARQTGNYVYSSAAVKVVDGLGPTVYFGSYDNRLYAVDARTGGVRWSYDAGGDISGSPTIVSDTIYFASRDLKRTLGLARADRAPRVRPVGGRLRPRRLRRHLPLPHGLQDDQRARAAAGGAAGEAGAGEAPREAAAGTAAGRASSSATPASGN